MTADVRGRVVLDGRRLTPAAVAAVAREGAQVTLDPAAIERNAAAHALGEQLSAGPSPLYGASTGVGALWDRPAEDDGEAHALALLRSHAGGAGPLVPPDQARALLVVRANQLAAGGAGVTPAVLAAIAAALNAGLAPAVHRLGGIGTGDLAALADAALALLGEGTWLPPTERAAPTAPAEATAPAAPTAPATEPIIPAEATVPTPAATATAPGGAIRVGRRDGLALLSSNAATVGVAALAWVDAAALLPAAEGVAALAHLAVRGDAAAYDPRVARARAHPGQVAAAAHLWSLLDGPRPPPARLQDPLSFRCAPQVCGAARDALDDLARVLAVELNAAAENPLLVSEDRAALHAGNFDTTRLALSLDLLRTALERVATLSVARLAALLDPRRTGLSAFLAGGEPSASGALILEYTAHAALGELRATLAPIPSGAVLAFGQEDVAPFTPAAARRLGVALQHAATVHGVEAVAAVRALRLAGPPPLPAAARRLFDLLDAALPGDLADRPLAGDIAAAAALLPTLTAPLTPLNGT